MFRLSLENLCHLSRIFLWCAIIFSNQNAIAQDGTGSSTGSPMPRGIDVNTHSRQQNEEKVDRSKLKEKVIGSVLFAVVFASIVIGVMRLRRSAQPNVDRSVPDPFEKMDTETVDGKDQLE